MMRWAMAAVLAVPTLAIPGAYAAGPMATPAVYSWTSCYVGGNAGVGWDSTSVVDENDSSIHIASLSSTAIMGGGQVGCDYQVSPQWVIGVQGMWDATGLKDSYTGTVRDEPLYGATLTGSVPWVATFTGRIGYLAAPNFMIYAKGGAAWNHTDAKIIADGDTIDSVGFGQTGWTAGLGAEWKHDTRWSFFAEYDYMGFGSTVVTFPNSDNVGSVSQNIQALLFGVNYHLN
jgi:outer membrane immunogenic protein